MAFDQVIMEFIKDYKILIDNTIGISGLIGAWVVICGFIRFSIGAWKRKAGIYPPAGSSEGHH